MRILVLSDIHANQTALETVLKSAGQVDAVWCLGDIIGYGPDPNECVEIVRLLPEATCLLGNHDAANIGQIDLKSFNEEARISIEWVQKRLTPANNNFLESLPTKRIIDEATLVHGSPRNPVWEYILDNYTATYNFASFDTPICMVGHTHLPSAFYAPDNGTNIAQCEILADNKQYNILNKRVILNPGSVGQPRDHDPRASYAIYYPEKGLWETHRVEYDILSVQRRIQLAGLPFRHAARLSEGW